MKNDVFLRALRREPTPYTPVWVMRQAGRYLPEYREVRQQAGDFMSLCQNPELACEVTLQPLRRFDLDAAILFSDILTIPDAMGLGLYFATGEGPKFENPVRTAADISALPSDYPEEKLRYVTDAVSTIKQHLKDELPLIGFSGSPWTLACYMIQGEGHRDFPLAKQMLYGEPARMHQLLSLLASQIKNYLRAQVEAGVDVVMLFDTWGGLLTPEDYQVFSLHYMQEIIQSIPSHIPTILFTKGGGAWLESMAETGVSALGVDWRQNMAEAFKRVDGKVALQGNIDPSVLLTTPEIISEKVSALKNSVKDYQGHVLNLGHGITPEVPVENMQAFIQAVKN